MRSRQNVVRSMAEAWSRWEREPSFPFVPDCCINGSRVVAGALANLGVKVRPVSVQFVLFNKPGWVLFSEQVPIEEWPEHAWSIGVGPGAPPGANPKSWDGHLCVEGEDFTLDISAGQFTRPGRIQIDGPRILQRRLPDEGLVHVEDERGQVLVIGRWQANNGWRNASGWKRLQAEEVAEITARTERVMAEREGHES